MLTEVDLETAFLDKIPVENILKSKVKSMFHLQSELNALINPAWASQPDWDFQRATMVELCELLDHYGYKWWKGHTPNIDQCKLEVIDIVHFHISHLMKLAIKEGQDFCEYALDLTNNLQPVVVDKSPEGIRKIIDECVLLASTKNFSSKALSFLLSAFEIDADELCNKYILKNTLNTFRAKNGYKAGTYIKTWGDQEDNEVLMEIYDSFDKTSPDLAEELYQALEWKYLLLTDQKAA